MLTRTRRRTEDLVGLARRLVGDGCRVAIAPRASDDVLALAFSLHDAGVADSCELDLVDPDLVEPVLAAGVGVAVPSPGGHPAARVVVHADEPRAVELCRALADRPVRLVRGRRRGADLTFVRCLNDLMAGAGRPAVAATDPRLIAITGERAAWNGRSPDTWEHVLPYGTLIDERRRLVASGCTVRVSVRFSVRLGRGWS